MSIVEQQTYARPYAEAAFRFAKQQKALSSWHDFLHAFAQLFADTRIQSSLNTPFVDQQHIVDLIGENLPNALNAQQLNFLKLLAESKRLSYLSAVSRYFNELQDQEEGILRVQAVSAFTMDEATQEHLRKQLSAYFKKTIQMETTMDESLIGGVKIWIGDRVVDASVKAQLAKLYQNLIQ